ncbi:hypothetical protein [Intestinibacter sp.]
MDNKTKNYNNLSIAGILFLMTGYLLDKIIKIDIEIMPLACYMISIVLLIISIFKNNKLKKEVQESKSSKKKKV